MRSIVIHGHFYQPPRENPFSGAVPHEVSSVVAIETQWTRLNRAVSEARAQQEQLQGRQFQAQLTATLVGGGQGGRLVIVDHGNGYETYYAHLSRFDVIAGQEIRQSEPVGAVGTSGRVTAPHLHYEVRLRKAPVNPYRFLAKTTTTQAKANSLF